MGLTLIRHRGIAIAENPILPEGFSLKRHCDWLWRSNLRLIKEGLPSYFPTVIQVILISGIIAAFLLVYTLGTWVLPLKEDNPRPI